MNHVPKISVIMPVYNVEKYLRESLDCIVNQTFDDFEVICVDDGSTDNSLNILKEYAQNDARFRILSQSNRGAGAARNYGFTKARGEYVIFLDGDDLFSPELLEKSYAAAVATGADIAAFHYSRFDGNGNSFQQKGIYTDWLLTDQKVFNYKDCPDLIMSIINPTPWNKLYRCEFIREKELKYDEISSSNDITFASVSAASAERVTYIEDSLLQYRIGHEGTITATKPKKLNNVITAVMSAEKQAKELPYGKEILKAIHRFVIEKYVFALKNNVVDFSADIVKTFYQHVHTVFNEEEYENIIATDLHNEELYRDFCTIRKHDYDKMKQLIKRRLIVSLTTYPARIGTLTTVLETIYAQTRPADEIVLWLAGEQFPNLENDLPDELREQAAHGKLKIKWCEDLKPHKKYFYALQEYADDVVVTIDDDLLYSPRLLERLWKSYLQYPDAVSAARVHLIVVSEQNEILSYEDWIKETDMCIYKPSMQLLATGGAGTLYPPGLLKKELFDKEAIMSTCLWADDLWLKAMELVSDVPVVAAQPWEGLKYIPGSQTVALYHRNVDQNENDIQLKKIVCWLDEHFEKDIFLKKLTASDIGESILGIKALCECFRLERIHTRKNVYMLQRKLQTAYDQKAEINAKLQRTYKEKSEISAKLQQTYKEKSEINAKLQKTYKEKAERGIKIKELEKEIQKLQTNSFKNRSLMFVKKVIRKIMIKLKNMLS